MKSVLFISPSVCPSCDTFFSGYSQWLFLIFAWGYLATYTKKKQSWILENCILYLDNWVNETNLDQKRNFWRFSEGNITFCALNDAPFLAISFCGNYMSGKKLVLKLKTKMLSTNQIAGFFKL